MDVLGLDIGGANIKFHWLATNQSGSFPFQLYRRPDDLARVLRDQFGKRVTSETVVALTMTGELCDCFLDRQNGVEQIVRQTEFAFSNCSLQIYSNVGEFMGTSDACRLWQRVAAANWHATASYWARQIGNGHGLVVDLGSTTTDLIPFRNQIPDPRGHTDFERLVAGELIYVGLSRTPVNLLFHNQVVNGNQLNLAAEWFATLLDVYLWIGWIPEDLNNRNTSDGQPAGRLEAARRLARLLCAAPSELPEGVLDSLARRAAEEHHRLLSSGIRQAVGRLPPSSEPANVVLCGEGEWLVKKICGEVLGSSVTLISQSEQLGLASSQSAAAFAIAHLYAQGVTVQ